MTKSNNSNGGTNWIGALVPFFIIMGIIFFVALGEGENLGQGGVPIQALPTQGLSVQVLAEPTQLPTSTALALEPTLVPEMADKLLGENPTEPSRIDEPSLVPDLLIQYPVIGGFVIMLVALYIVDQKMFGGELLPGTITTMGGLLKFFFKLGFSLAWVIFSTVSLLPIWSRLGTFTGVLKMIWGVKEEDE